MRAATVSAAARQAGVSVESIRFYERRGLITQAPKPEGFGFRIYPAEVVKRIHFIRLA
jgi:DNA-binding transcriptional MerR regulator